MRMVSHPLIKDGLTHADSVAPVVRSIGLVAVVVRSVTVTQSSNPSNCNAFPNLPGTRSAWRIVPFMPDADESSAVAPACSSKPNARTRPAGCGAPDDTTIATALSGAILTPAIGFEL